MVCSQRRSLVILRGCGGLPARQGKRAKARPAKAVHTRGGAHTKLCTHKAMQTQGGAHTRWCTHKAVCGHRKSLVIQGGCGGWSPRLAKRAEGKDGWAVPTQGGAHKRWCKHKAVGGHRRSLVIQGECGGWPPRRAKRGEARGGFGGPHTRRCTQKIMHTQRRAHTRRCTHKEVCGHRRSLVIEGGCRGWPRRLAKRADTKVVLVVHTQGGAQRRQLVAIAGALSFNGGGWTPCRAKLAEARGGLALPHTRRCTHKVVHTQGGAHIRRSAATAGVLLSKGDAGVGLRVQRSETKQGVLWHPGPTPATGHGP